MTFGTLGCRPWARSVLHCRHGVLVLREGPLTGAVQDKSQLQEDTSKLAVGGAEEQAKSRFGASFYSLQKVTFGTLGCRPQARSVLHCHGVLALRQIPLTGAVQDESQLQEDTSKLAVGSAEEQAKSRFLITSEGDVWHSGLPAAGPIHPSLPWWFGAARGSFDRSCAGRKLAGSWQCRRAGKVKVWC